MHRRAVVLSILSLPLSARSQQLTKKPMPVSPEALQRKTRSIEILRQDRIPVNEHLPVIETSLEVKPRDTQEVVTRALALTVVAEKGATQDHVLAQRMTKGLGVEKGFTPKERAFVDNPRPSQKDLVQFSWRYEGFGVLLWALNFLPEMGKPTLAFEAPKLAGILMKLGVDEFRRNAKLRGVSELLNEADLIYRYHWAVVDARIKGKSSPGGLNPSAVYERHYALNWLIRYQDQDWDAVSTDT